MRRKLGLYLIMLLLAGCASVASIKYVPRVDSHRNVLSSILIEVKNIEADLSAGQDIGAFQYGLACIPTSSNKWNGNEIKRRKQEMIRIVRDELVRMGYKVKDPEKVSSQQDEPRPVYSIVGRIVDLKANICYPYAGFGVYNKVKGNGYMRVKWEVYDSSGLSALSFSTEGSGTIKDASSSNEDTLYFLSFGTASANIAGSDEFYSLMKGK